MGSRLTFVGGARFVGASFLLSVTLLGFAALPGCGDSSDYAPTYDVEISGLGEFRIGALQLEVEYLGDRGDFVGRGDAVDCVSLVEDALVASNHIRYHRVRIGLISLDGIALPAPVMRCGFRTSEDLTPASFSVVVTDASDTNSVQLDPSPEVVVSTVTPR